MTDPAREEAYQTALQLHQQGRLAEAVGLYRGLTQPVVTVKVAASLGVALLHMGEYAEAEHWLGLAARHRPGEPALRLNLARVYDAQGRVDLAELEYRTVLVLKPDADDARLALAGLLLSVGRYAEGWPLLEVRAQLRPDVVPPVSAPFPEWRGEPVDGKSVLIWYEQGLGDQIQMCRFAQSLKARGASKVTLGCRPQLTDLFSTMAAVDEILPVPQGAAIKVGGHDYWTRYFSTPHHLGVTLANLPNQPYLSAPPDRRARWRGFSGVGLAWKASPTGFNGRNKGLPPEAARALLDLGAISLDPADTGVSDFADTAAIIEQLDLVISIDSSVAHLAGAMGKPCWTLLPFLLTDWRWLRARSDSPWYPSMRLYRQSRPGDWSDVLQAVIRDLHAEGLARAEPPALGRVEG